MAFSPDDKRTMDCLGALSQCDTTSDVFHVIFANNSSTVHPLSFAFDVSDPTISLDSFKVRFFGFFTNPNVTLAFGMFR